MRDIGYTSGGTSAIYTEASNHTSGTLAVTDGTHTADITLLQQYAGQYSTGTFKLSDDGQGGTMIVDPPLTKSNGQLSLGSHNTHELSWIGRRIGTAGNDRYASTVPLPANFIVSARWRSIV